MPTRRTPTWISLGGAWLALIAGYVNALGFLGAARRGLSHVTGQVTELAIEMSDGHTEIAGSTALLVAMFFLGAAISGALISDGEVSVSGRRYGVVLLLESAVLATAGVLMPRHPWWAVKLMPLAMGMQNALATSYSGAVVRTTHVTGLVTDLGLLLGRTLRGEDVDTARLKLLALLFFSFFLGGILGVEATRSIGEKSLFVASGALALAAIDWRYVSTRAAR